MNTSPKITSINWHDVEVYTKKYIAIAIDDIAKRHTGKLSELAHSLNKLTRL